MVLGGKTSVHFNTAILDSVDDVLVVHTHDDDTMFSGTDWATFIARDNADLDILVTESFIYVLEKGSRFEPFAYLAAKLHGPDEHFDRIFSSFPHDTSAEFRNAVASKNLEMAKLYGVDLRRYQNHGRI
jgi:hypothetical protein